MGRACFGGRGSAAARPREGWGGTAAARGRRRICSDGLLLSPPQAEWQKLFEEFERWAVELRVRTGRGSSCSVNHAVGHEPARNAGGYA
jgi:hypothetical protein